MTVAEIKKAQDRIAPKDDLKPYTGQWVAIRDGHVVASDLDPVGLREKPEVEPSDLLMPVPPDDALLIL